MPVTGTARLSGEEGQAILLDEAAPRHSTSSSGSSDLAYIDNLDVEPFPEKDARFEDEPRLEYGEGYDDDDEARGFMSNQRTVSSGSHSKLMLSSRNQYGGGTGY